MNTLEQEMRRQHYEGALRYLFGNFALNQVSRMAPFVADPDYEVVIHIFNDGMTGLLVRTRAKLRKETNEETED